MKAIVLAMILVVASAAAAHAARFTADDRETVLISTTAGGGFPNAASRNAAISQDRQRASYVAYESDASNIVGGDTNGTTDVFLVARRRPFDLSGGPWEAGRTRLVSVGYDGAPANGPSTRPDLGGDQLHSTRCVAFVSAASNLVRGDTNDQPDAFVQDLATRKTRRVSLATGGKQTDGATYEVQVDGSCTRVAFVSDASNLPGARSGIKQVYMRVGGRTVLASASTSGRAGNGDSTHISMSKLGGAPGCTRSCHAKVGEAVAYQSTATNLAPHDHNRASDVFVTSVSGKSLRRRTSLVSRGINAGNGASTEPDIGDNGAWVAYRTEATDLLPGDTNGVADIARANAQRPGANAWVSYSGAVGGPANGPSADPTITRSGSMVFFESDASNLQATVRNQGFFDRNQSGDMFFYAALSGNVSLQSRDSDNQILNNPVAGVPHQPHAPAHNPASSYYGNYVLWESAYPLIDRALADDTFGDLTPYDAAGRSVAEPKLNQVYLRYIGPA